MNIVTRNIPYEHRGEPFQGYLAYDDTVTGKRPGVLVVHEYYGLNDYTRTRAQQLASLGYVAFALDMFGKGRVAESPDEARKLKDAVSENVETWQSLAKAGLEILMKDPRVGPDRVAAIGYCFGGSTIQQLAYTGAPIRGLVSFHGSPIPPPEKAASLVKAKFLICHGAIDPLVSDAQLHHYLAAMKQSGLDWQMIFYSGAKHAFTNPDSDKRGSDNVAYNEAADRRSWSHMKQFFDEIFAPK
jgi:dienelactone hydrolase